MARPPRVTGTPRHPVEYRRRESLVCSECGKGFEGYPGAYTCSSTCRSRRKRRLEKAAAGGKKPAGPIATPK